MKRWICAVLAVVLCFGMSSLAVAEDEVIEIGTAAEFLSIRNDLTAEYVLTEDIVFTASDYQPGGLLADGFVPFGLQEQYDVYKGHFYEVEPFTGTLDGGGHHIIGLEILLVSTSALQNNYAGLFADNAGTICNLAFSGEVSFRSDESNSLNTFLVGTLAAHNAADGTLRQCSVSGSVYAKTQATVQIGGIVGENAGTVVDCYTDAEVCVGNTKKNMRMGGIIGYAKPTSEVRRVFGAGMLWTESAFGTASMYCGNLIGYNNGAIYDAYVLTGISRILGRDSATSAQRKQNSMAQLSAEQAAKAETFSEFNFSEIWTMGDAAPELKLFAHSHSFGEWIQQDGNCLYAGSQHRVCSVCGKNERVFTAFGEHCLNEGTVITPPTCATTGVAEKTCVLCGNTVTAEVPIDETAHVWQDHYTEDFEATCDHGAQQSIHCEYCTAIKDVITTKRLPLFSLALESTGVTALDSGKYQLDWRCELGVVGDTGSMDFLVVEYGIMYAADEQTLQTYMDNTEAGESTEGLKVSIFPAVSCSSGLSKLYRYTNFRLNNVPENRQRFAVTYIRYELDGTLHEDYSLPAYAETVQENV